MPFKGIFHRPIAFYNHNHVITRWVDSCMMCIYLIYLPISYAAFSSFMANRWSLREVIIQIAFRSCTFPRVGARLYSFSLPSPRVLIDQLPHGDSHGSANNRPRSWGHRESALSQPFFPKGDLERLPGRQTHHPES